jgi:exosome complex component CSL4
LLQVQSKNSNETQFVVPGERLGVVEEFMPGPGTYERDGTIYSEVTGYTTRDKVNKTVSVKPSVKRPLVPMEGDTVIGTVVNAQGKMATLSLTRIGDKTLSTPFSAILHISTSSPRYERAMMEVCKAADVVRARVVNIRNRVPQLTTIGRGLGVISASCSRCGDPLILKGTVLQCQTCMNIERRKLADDYGKNIM